MWSNHWCACPAVRGAVKEDHELVVAHQLDETPAILLDRRPDLEARREHGEPYPLARHWSYGAKQVLARPAGLTLGLIRQGMEVAGSTQHAPFGQKILVSSQNVAAVPVP
jgi:hypothetical protein